MLSGNNLSELLLLILQEYRKGGESPLGNQSLGHILVAFGDIVLFHLSHGKRYGFSKNYFLCSMFASIRNR